MNFAASDGYTTTKEQLKNYTSGATAHQMHPNLTAHQFLRTAFYRPGGCKIGVGGGGTTTTFVTW